MSESANSNDEPELKLVLGKKKKRRKNKKKHNESNNDTESSDYSYIELLKRVYQQMDQTKQSTKISVPRPQLARSGRSTIWLNFNKVAIAISRKQLHVKQFVETELQVKTSVLDNSQLKLYRFNARKTNFEKLIHSYISKYVMCTMCRSLDTCLVKNSTTRLTSMECNICHAQRTIDSVVIKPKRKS